MIHPFIGWVIPTQWFRGLNQGKPKWIHLIWVKKLEKWWKKTCVVIVSTCSYLVGIYIPPPQKTNKQKLGTSKKLSSAKKNPSHWLFDREAYNDVSMTPTKLGRISSPTLNNQGAIHCSTRPNLRWFNRTVTHLGTPQTTSMTFEKVGSKGADIENPWKPSPRHPNTSILGRCLDPP